MLRNPVVSWTSAEETSTNTEMVTWPLGGRWGYPRLFQWPSFRVMRKLVRLKRLR